MLSLENTVHPGSSMARGCQSFTIMLCPHQTKNVALIPGLLDDNLGREGLY